MTLHRSKLILLTVLLLISAMVAQSGFTQATPACPLGQGYWANNPESWTATSLMLGTQSYTQSELQAIIPGGGGDASTILAVQLIAAKLNIAAGADAAPVSEALAQADTFLGQHTGKLPYNIAPSSAEGQAMVSIAGTLDSFNNGQLTPNCATTPTPTAAPTRPAVIVVIQGPVQVINVNIITIAGIHIQVSADNPILPVVQVGTPVRVEGTAGTDSNGVVIVNAAVITLAPADVTTNTIFIQGMVDAINANIITIGGISIQIDPANPTLPAVQVGDVIEINANLNFDGVTVIVVATSVTIVINTVPEATPTFTPTTTPPTATSTFTATPTGTLTVTPPAAGLPVTIIVEGPVQVINVNIITIYDIDITIDANDPVLTSIQVGDFVRIEGNALDGVDTLVVVAVTVFVVDVDVIVSNNNIIIWNDDGNCSNPPPPWAPAHGWRRRCENPNNIIIIVGDDDDDGMGMGMGDDD